MADKTVLLAPRHPDDDPGPIIEELAAWVDSWYGETAVVSRRREELFAIEGLTDHQVDEILDEIDPNWFMTIEHLHFPEGRAAEVLARH
jgi:hypothetical protein